MIARAIPMPLHTAAYGSRSAEEQLVCDAAGGDRAAFGELYNRYARMVHAIVLARVPYSNAEDLVQDVFVSAYGKLGRLRQPAAFAGWLAAMARRRATEFYRGRREEAGDGREPTRDPGHDEALVVLDVIRKLPEAYRETLILRLVEGFNGAEIAQQTGLTPDSVRVNLHRGMKLLRERLGGSG